MKVKRFLQFLLRSFSDVRGAPDGKLLTIAAVATVVVATYPVGWLWHVWPPEYIFGPTLLFLAAGLGIDAYVTHSQIKADSAVAQATATGLPVGEESPAPALAAAPGVQVNTILTEAPAPPAPARG
jgi:hypothetical protein